MNIFGYNDDLPGGSAALRKLWMDASFGEKDFGIKPVHRHFTPESEYIQHYPYYDFEANGGPDNSEIAMIQAKYPIPVNYDCLIG
jgi:hypothetical protein